MYDGLLEHITSDRKDAVFSFDELPSEDAYKASLKAQAALQTEKKKPGVPGAPAAAAKPGAAPTEQKAEQKAAATAELTRIVGEIVQADVGPVQHSCKPKYLTESEAEYTVQVIKHMFKDYVVLEMYVNNTVPGNTLENVEARLSGVGGDWMEAGASAISKLENGQQASAHVVLQKGPGVAACAGALTGSFGVALKYIIKEEGDDLGYEDDYPVENVTICLGDYMFPKMLPAGQFKSVWESLTAQGHEEKQQLGLNFKNIDPAVEYCINTLNMEPCDKSATVDSDKTSHSLLVSGTFLGGHSVLAKVLTGKSPKHPNVIICRIQVKAKSPEVCSIMAQALT